MQKPSATLVAALKTEFIGLLTLAWPLILGELGWIAMSVVDTMMLGRTTNSSTLMSAVALAQVLFNTIAFAFGGILLSLDTVISQALGAEDKHAARSWLQHGLVIAIIISLTVLVLIEAGPLVLNHLPVDREILATAVPTLRALNLGTLPLLVYFALRRYLQAAHRVRPIAIALISANIVNAAGDWLLIFGHTFRLGTHTIDIPAYGAVGSGWATSLARLYLMLFMLLTVLHHGNREGHGIFRNTWKIELQHLRKLCSIGLPAGGQILIEVGIFALATSIIATLGAVPLAGHQIALECASTVFMVPFAISSATAVRVGHAVGRASTGAGMIHEAARAGWVGIGASASFMLLVSLVFQFFPAWLGRLFTSDAAIIHAAVPLLITASAFQFFDGIQITVTGALRGIGDTLSPLLIQIVCFWFSGMWWGLSLALTAAAIVMAFVWKRKSHRLAH